MSARPRVFVIRFGALGDVVLTTPLLRGLRKHHPDLRVTTVTRRAHAPLLETHPAVSAVAPLDPGEGLLSFSRRLGITADDLVLDLHSSLRSHALRLTSRGQWHTVTKNRRSRRQRLRGRKMPPDRPVAERYFSAASCLGLVPDGEPAELFTTAQDEVAASRQVAPGSVVLAPGAGHATKRWPAERWRDLAASLDKRGWRVTVERAA